MSGLMGRISVFRGLGLLSALALAVGIYRLLCLAAPQAPISALASVSLFGLLVVGLFVLASSERALSAMTPYFALGAAGMLAAPGLLGTQSLPYGLLSFFLLASLLVSAFPDLARLWRTLTRAEIAFALLWACALLGYNWYFLLVSQPIMWSDFMVCRFNAVQLAQAIRDGQGVAVLALVVRSFTFDYSLVPAVVPGLLLAIGGTASRAVYQSGVVLAYAAPAFLALGLWSREIARRTGAETRRSGDLAVAVVFIGLALPGSMTVAALGMPDIGGVALVVWGLYLIDALCRHLELGVDAGPDVERAAMRTAGQLAACLFAMFLFRRWYLFASLGLVIGLGVELAWLAFSRRGRFPWRAATMLAGFAGSIFLVLASPVILDWLPEWKSHDYASMYAGYNYGATEFVRHMGAWYGHGIVALAIVSAFYVGVRKLNNRPLRLTLVASCVGFGVELYVQSPSVHHTYLILPALAAPIGAAAVIAFRRGIRFPAVAALGLAACTLTPLAEALPLRGWAPTLALPESPRSDLSELSRLREWTYTHAAPDRRYCVLASNSVVSGVLVDQLWQLEPAQPPVISQARKNDIILPQVDARDGPPDLRMKDCAFILVSDPIQTSLDPDFQLSIVVPSRELLFGQGVGLKFQRTGDKFTLVGGVKLVVFGRIAPLTDEDIAGLVQRWRAAPRSEAARRAAKDYL